jgi:hypothetical protein
MQTAVPGKLVVMKVPSGARKKPTKQAVVLQKSPVRVPAGLIARTSVNVEPGTSIVVRVPLLSRRQPCSVKLGTETEYVPAIAPDGLMLGGAPSIW